ASGSGRGRKKCGAPSRSTSCSRRTAWTASSGRVFPLFFANYLERLAGAPGVRKRVPHLLILKQSRDPGQRADVLLHRLAGNHQQDDDPRGTAVRRLEGNPAGRDPQRRHRILDAVDARVRDRDAVLHARGGDLLARGQRLVDELAQFGLETVLRDQELDQLRDRLPLVLRLEIRDDLAFLEQVSELHESSSFRWASSSASFAFSAPSFASISAASSGLRFRNSGFASCCSLCPICDFVFSIAFFVRSI